MLRCPAVLGRTLPANRPNPLPPGVLERQSPNVTESSRHLVCKRCHGDVDGEPSTRSRWSKPPPKTPHYRRGQDPGRTPCHDCSGRAARHRCRCRSRRSSCPRRQRETETSSEPHVPRDCQPRATDITTPTRDESRPSLDLPAARVGSKKTLPAHRKPLSTARCHRSLPSHRSGHRAGPTTSTRIPEIPGRLALPTDTRRDSHRTHAHTNGSSCRRRRRQRLDSVVEWRPCFEERSDKGTSR